jgi:hypothetical protein
MTYVVTVNWGYEKRNIRVLSDICGGFLGLADPTRENVVSLEKIIPSVL